MENTSIAQMTSPLNSTAEDEIVSTPFGILVKTFMVVAIFLNLLLNPLMLLTLRRVTSIQPTTKIFMASLTLSDLCNSLWWILNSIGSFSETWLLGDFLCAASSVIDCEFGGLSVFSLLLLTIDRYIAISHPLRYPTMMTMCRSKITVLSVWATISISNILIFGVINPAYILQDSYNRRICVLTGNWTIYIPAVLTVLALLAVFILYAHIALIARNQARRIAAENQAGNGQGGQRINTRSTTTTTTIIIITGTLIITWIPAVIRLAILPQNKWKPYDMNLAYIFTQAMLLSNGWLNVIIYYLRNRDLRQTLCKMLSDWRKSLSRRLWG